MGFLLSPIMLIWFLVTPVIGVYNVVQYYPSIFKAISPRYIIEFFRVNQKEGWIALGGVVLCITGAFFLVLNFLEGDNYYGYVSCSLVRILRVMLVVFCDRLSSGFQMYYEILLAIGVDIRKLWMISSYTLWEKKRMHGLDC